MDIPRPKRDRPSRTARVWWCIIGFLFGSFAGFAVGYQFGFPYSVLVAVLLGVVLAADGLRAGSCILASIFEAWLYL